MKIFAWFLCGISLLGSLALGADDDFALWKARLQVLHPGLTRAQVEGVLDQLANPPAPLQPIPAPVAKASAPAVVTVGNSMTFRVPPPEKPTSWLLYMAVTSGALECASYQVTPTICVSLAYQRDPSLRVFVDGPTDRVIGEVTVSRRELFPAALR